MLWNWLAILYQWKSVCLNKNNPTKKQSQTAPLDSRPLPSFHLLWNLPLSKTSLCSRCLFSFLQLLSCLAVSWTNARQWGSLTREQPGSTDKWARLCKEKGKEKRNKDCQHCHWKKKRALTSEQPSQLPGQMSSALQRERKKNGKYEELGPEEQPSIKEFPQFSFLSRSLVVKICATNAPWPIALWQHFWVSKSLEWSPVFKNPKLQKNPRNPKT